ncbi:type 4a pilus biogenesis protein PilO [Porticoccus sp. W117]|uniref:type 4a pilus biogenesis protein PilO n=1 Tax=Porticoccus sp. W117 TaxID=3054777 RepID=UPI00259AAE76|nr:type 4a pilus biogenesis protein PilO [Porticoccus sp. W117]MDM3870921.1 type 4a pilus biogenesis protein PilO [Porticoccus sp. W117]
MALSDSLQEMKNFDTSELTLENIGIWPAAYKAIALLFVVALVLGGTYYLYIGDMNSQLASETRKERQLKQDYKKKAFDAANLDALKAQMADLEESFKNLKSQLPKDTDIPDLVDEIYDAGRGSSGVVAKVEMNPERDAELFIEQPMDVIVEGGYHDFGSFVSTISALSRIVTLHDFKIARAGDSSSLLRMEIKAKTYRYKAEEGEE